MTETADPVRVALIGFGFVGKTFHAPLIQSVPGLELTLVSSRHPELVRKSLPQAQVLDEPEDVATHAGVDLVVIASPNETHVPLATAALNAGKHVIVDKPFTITLAEARRLRDLSRSKGRLLSVFQNRRWDSEFLGARQVIEDGRVGEVRHFESHFDRFRPEIRDRWREAGAPGAGLWYDLGPHLADQGSPAFWVAEFA
jgi:Predicted dehydrogenases and related proteins